MVKKHVFGSFNLNNSEKHRLSFEHIFWRTLDSSRHLYEKKITHPWQFWGGVHGKVCWLIAYIAHSLSSRDSTSFWKDDSKMANSKVPLAPKVENAVGSHEIIDMWQIHFSDLLNTK